MLKTGGLADTSVNAIKRRGLQIYRYKL